MTDDERAGAEWWNSLTHVARAYWLMRVGRADASAADAWAVYKASTKAI